MTDEVKNIRMERIERLLRELEYEVVRGMMEGELDETIRFEFYVPTSKKIPDGAVLCRFATRPIMRHDMEFRGQARLRIVK